MSNLKEHTVEVNAHTLSMLLDFARPELPFLKDQIDELSQPIYALLGKLTKDLVGAIVAPKVGTNYLRAGTTAYDRVIVISKDPFVVVSSDNEHEWREQDPKQFYIIGTVTEEFTNKLKKKWLK